MNTVIERVVAEKLTVISNTCLIIAFKRNEMKIRSIEQAFCRLPELIPQIHHFEWGINNSKEGLHKDFTHCFTLHFKKTTDMDTYLPHPAHKEFVAQLDGIVEDVLVFDYWAK